jgi:hypothetical protein
VKLFLKLNVDDPPVAELGLKVGEGRYDHKFFIITNPFIDHRFARLFRNWFSSILQMQTPKYIDNLVNLCDRSWSKQCGQIVLKRIINIVETIVAVKLVFITKLLIFKLR